MPLNAGILRSKPVETVDEASFDDLVNVDFKGQLTLQKALPLLNDEGSVIFTVGIGTPWRPRRLGRHRDVGQARLSC